MNILLFFAIPIGFVHAEDDAEGRYKGTLTPAYPFITLVNSQTVTTVVTVVPSCYEPAETINLCLRKKRQLALLLDPFGYGSHTQPNHYQQASPYILSDADSYLIDTYDTLPRSNAPSPYLEPEISPSFRSGSYDKYLPKDFLVNFGAFITNSPQAEVTVTSKVVSTETQTVALDCLYLGSTIPSDLCPISMIFPRPPIGVDIQDYCAALANLGGVAVEACNETPLVDGIGVYIRFKRVDKAQKKSLGIVLPSKKLIIKNILKQMINNCNVPTGDCDLPGLPLGFKLKVFNIFIPGVNNIRDFIIQILSELIGGPDACSLENGQSILKSAFSKKDKGANAESSKRALVH